MSPKRPRRLRRRSGEQVDHNHPGGTGAVLGVRLMRFAGVQGTALVVGNVLMLASMVAVGWFLGPSDLGRYSLLFFLTSLITQVIHIATKPGTIRRTFGAGDEEEDDDDDESELSDRPPWTLGIGLVMCVALGLLATLGAYLAREPLADLLLGSPEHGNLVVWSAVTAALLGLFKLAEISLWFERRPTAFLVCDTARPVLVLAAVVGVLAAGGGLEGAVIGAAAGTGAAALMTLFALRGSFVVGFDVGESLRILDRSRVRFPIISSMWLIQNADTFLLSRFVDHHELGLYQLATRTGFAVAILPQGFRIAMRPLRKSAAYRAVRREYGQAVAQGQLLAYFVLLCIGSVLAIVLAGDLVVNIAPPEFESAAPLIPLAAGAMVMPALYRTINGMSVTENKRRVFVISTILAAAMFIGLTLVLAPEIGIYAPPVAMMACFVLPSAYMFARSQRGAVPLDFPYGAVMRALVVAVAIGGGYHLLQPSSEWAQAALVLALMGGWLVSLFVLRVIPEYHWGAIGHMARSLVSGSAMRFNARKGLRKLPAEQRAELRRAIVERMSAAELAGDGGVRDADGDGVPEGGGDGVRGGGVRDRGDGDATLGSRLVVSLRRVGRRGGVPVGRATKFDAEIASFLFADEPMATRQAKMRSLISAGAEAHDLRVLEELAERLARSPEGAWEGKKAGDDPGIGTRLRRA